MRKCAQPNNYSVFIKLCIKCAECWINGRALVMSIVAALAQNDSEEVHTELRISSSGRWVCMLHLLLLVVVVSNLGLFPEQANPTPDHEFSPKPRPLTLLGSQLNLVARSLNNARAVIELTRVASRSTLGVLTEYIVVFVRHVPTAPHSMLAGGNSVTSTRQQIASTSYDRRLPTSSHVTHKEDTGARHSR
jgi:hypothetical protein